MFALGALLPVVLIWAFAAMVRRAQEMRIAAQSMTEVAFRLAEPENLAQDRVMMVGQAVRREVAAMGEGIERTLARAVELETLVHTEVNQIERSYSENAARIRALVDGLGSEREAVVTHAERVRASITGAHETLRDEIGQASDIIRDSILNASTNLSMTITNSGDTLIDRINESGMNLFDSMDSRVDSITDRLTTSGEAFASLLDTRIAKLTDSTDNLTRSLTDLLDDRTSGMVSLLGGAARTLSSEFEASLNSIERTLSERGQGLISEFETRAHALDTGTAKLNAALEARARQINETLVERAKEIATTFIEGKETLFGMIDEGKSRIGAEMSDIVQSTSSMLEVARHRFRRAARPCPSCRLARIRRRHHAAFGGAGRHRPRRRKPHPQACGEPRPHGVGAADRSGEIRRGPRHRSMPPWAPRCRSSPKAATCCRAPSTRICARSTTSARRSTLR